MGVLIRRKIHQLSVVRGNWSPQDSKVDIAYPAGVAGKHWASGLQMREGHPRVSSLFQTVAEDSS